MMRVTAAVLALLLSLSSAAGAAPLPPSRVTILYDAFGDRAGLELDWGFSALVEYGGRRILFDAGNAGELFARHVRALGVDLKRRDFAGISPRLVGRMHPDSGQFEVGMLDDGAERPRADVARGPLHHSIRHEAPSITFASRAGSKSAGASP